MKYLQYKLMQAEILERKKKHATKMYEIKRKWKEKNNDTRTIRKDI